MIFPFSSYGAPSIFAHCGSILCDISTIEGIVETVAPMVNALNSPKNIFILKLSYFLNPFIYRNFSSSNKKINTLKY